MNKEKLQGGKGLRKLLSRFRREDRGTISLEIALAISFLGFGFVGLLTTATSIDNDHAGEKALNDVVMTVRALPSVDVLTNTDLEALLSRVAQDNLRSSQRVDLSVSRNCGCPLQDLYSANMCSVEACDDGSKPGRYVDIAMTVLPTQPSSNSKKVETFLYNTSVQYRGTTQEPDDDEVDQ